MTEHTPYYSYDKALLLRTIEAASKASAAVPFAHIHYAVKANNNPDILREMAAAGFGADCVSGGEIRQSIEAGIDPRKIVFAGVGKTDGEILYALNAGIGCFNVESREELSVLNELALSIGKKAPVALRINPDIGAHTYSYITSGLGETKFGINLEQAPQTVKTALTLPGIDFLGLHFHVGSQILDMNDFVALCNRINDLQRELEHDEIHLRSINVGGGLGVDYEHPEENPVPDFEAYFRTFAQHLELREGQEFHCEPGRSLVAQCGTLITSCIFVKEGTFKKFVIVDAGMNDLVRPAMYHAFHKIENISNPSAHLQLYDIVGPVCESSDCFAKGRYLPQTRRGDLIAIRSAGAYCESMSSTYNSRPLPKSEYR